MATKRKLQVFISSTFTDMHDERQAAVSAILKAGHIPAGMELFTAGDQSQTETIERWIDESDVYLLILGGRYGSVSDQTNLSYTENEYDYALSKGKAMFSVVIQDDALHEKIKKGGVNVIEQENPAKLRTFRLKVLSKLSSFYLDTKDIKLSVYESLQEFMLNRDLGGWVRSSELTGYQNALDEIVLLRSRNESIQFQLDNLLLRDSAIKMPEASDSQDYTALDNTLKSIPIKWPDELYKDNFTTSLSYTLINNRGMFTNGFKTDPNSSPMRRFYAAAILPIFISHGLLKFDKLHDSSLYTLTDKGHGYLAWLDRKKVKDDVK